MKNRGLTPPPPKELTIRRRQTPILNLLADCLYTGISSGPNARYRVWEAFTFNFNRVGTMRMIDTRGVYHVTAEHGRVAENVSDEHRVVGQVLERSNDQRVRARDLVRRAAHRQATGAVRQSPERTRYRRGRGGSQLDHPPARTR